MPAPRLTVDPHLLECPAPPPVPDKPVTGKQAKRFMVAAYYAADACHARLGQVAKVVMQAESAYSGKFP